MSARPKLPPIRIEARRAVRREAPALQALRIGFFIGLAMGLIAGISLGYGWWGGP